MDDQAEALDEAAIQAVMEDVGLTDLVCDDAEETQVQQQSHEADLTGNSTDCAVEEDAQQQEEKLASEESCNPDDKAGEDVKMECDDAPVHSSPAEEDGLPLSPCDQGSRDVGLEASKLVDDDQRKEDGNIK